MAPSNPLRLQVIDRVVTVLKAVVAGDNYFYTPYDVVKSRDILAQANGFPLYMTYIDSSEPHAYAGAEHNYDETITLIVEGIVQNLSDSVGVAEKALRDVRRALDQDSQNGAAGSLNLLCVSFHLGPTEMAYDEKGFGWFYQQFMLTISGEYGEI